MELKYNEIIGAIVKPDDTPALHKQRYWNGLQKIQCQ
jgi:hypothetical protein